MIITVTLQLGRGFQPVEVPTKPLDSVKLADDIQPSLVCATLCAGWNKWCRLSAASRGSEGRIGGRLALRVVIECPRLVVRAISKEGSVRDFAEGILSPGVLQGVLAARRRWRSLISRCLLARLGFGCCRISSLWRHRDRKGR